MAVPAVSQQALKEKIPSKQGVSKRDHNLEPLRQASSLFTLLKREWAITWAICKNNFPGNLAGFLGGFIPRLLVHPVPFATGSTAFLRMMITCLIWVYVFDIANTTSSVEEDKLNKPHRPIPAGLITVKQARVLISWCLAPSILALLYGKWPAFYMVLKQTWVFGFYVWPAYRHWLTKSIMVTGATFIMLRLLNAVILDIDQWWMGPKPDMIVCVWTMATIHLQDFRDIEGDRTTHAHAVTMPIVLSPAGQAKLRHTTACILIGGNIISISWIWMRAQCASAFLTGLLFNMSSSILAFYTVISTSRYQDRVMYRWWMATGFCVINHVSNLYLLQNRRG